MAKKKEETKVMKEVEEEKMQEEGQEAAQAEEMETGQEIRGDESESPRGRLVETIVEYLRVRAGAGTHHMEVAILAEPEGAKKQHRIVKEKKGWGLLEEYQEHEDGWICLEFTRAAG